MFGNTDETYSTNHCGVRHIVQRNNSASNERLKNMIVFNLNISNYWIA